MKTKLIRIEKIIEGTAQLFTSMDKGFARVESDLTLLTRFRQICYEANQKLECGIPKLKDHISLLNDLESYTNLEAEHQEAILNDLYEIRDDIADNIMTIADYIDSFTELWKKSFSLSALLKFKLLLINEFSLLDKEIETLYLEHLRLNRVKEVNLRHSVLQQHKSAGLDVNLE
jgi:hypothetical protein